MTDKEAMKLALEALRMAYELCEGHGVDFKEYGLKFDKDIPAKYDNAIIALKERLAQPEQEPMAWAALIDENQRLRAELKLPPHPHSQHLCKSLWRGKSIRLITALDTKAFTQELIGQNKSNCGNARAGMCNLSTPFHHSAHG